MGKDEIWIENLRSAGRGYEMTPPAGLWAGIEAALPAAAPPVRPVGFFQRYGALLSAACFAALVVLSVYIYYVSDDKGDADMHMHNSGGGMLAATESPEATAGAAIGEEPASLQAFVPEPVTAGAGGDKHDCVSVPDTPDRDLTPHGSITYYEQIVVIGGDDGNGPADRGTLTMADGATGPQVPGGRPVHTLPKPSVKLYAATSLPPAGYGAPIKAGVTADLRLSGRVGVEAGLTYTAMHGGGHTNDYVGVPVRVNYDVCGGDRLRVYAQAGGAVEKSLDTRDLQLSVGVGGGVEYAVSDDWGVFVEPSVNYYPDCGGKVNTMYKDRQVSAELRVGLRHSFNL